MSSSASSDANPPTPSGVGQGAVFSLGHSSMESDDFIRLLRAHRVELLVDVRSQPVSGRFPQFNHAVLEKVLERGAIAYLFLGGELGGRPDDPAAYASNGVVNYRARRKSYAFGAGLERVAREAQSRRVALMCAEDDPLECHRFLMISPELAARGFDLLHLRRDGSVETQRAVEDRLLRSTGFGDLAADTLFPNARAEALERAFDLQAQKCAFRLDPLLVERL